MTELTVRRSIPAPVERVWRAFTTDELGTWFWPASWNTVTTVDGRVGGRYSIVSDSVGMGVSGVLLELEPTSKIVQTWR